MIILKIYFRLQWIILPLLTILCYLPKVSRQIGFNIVDETVVQVQYVATSAKKIQNWYKLRTFPLYVVTVAISIILSFEQFMIWQSVFKWHWQVGESICVPFIWTDNTWKTYEFAICDGICIIFKLLWCERNYKIIIRLIYTCSFCSKSFDFNVM